jgi:transposase InsO family protein
MINQEAIKKAKILTFWHNHGLQATIDAYGVKRSTLFLWRKKLKESKGRLDSLNNQSRAPKKRRKRIIAPEVKSFIIEQRTTIPRLGKDKIAKMLKDENITKLSGSTAGRMLNDLKKRGELPQYAKVSLSAKTGRMIERKAKKRKKLRRKGYKPESEGDLLQLDTIEKFINGIKRYVVTAIDLKSDFGFAFAYKSANSKNTADFFQKLQTAAPFKIKRIQTDNGSEFEKYFRTYVEKNRIIHFHNYPRCPKMNAYVERFNRTLQEEFINYRKQEWAYNLNRFNHNLIDYLLWYNTKRPHWSLGLKSPMQYIISNLTPQKSNMLWTITNS